MIVEHERKGGRAALVTLTDEVAEIEELALSAGYQIVYEIIQRRKRSHGCTFVGKGKLEELKTILSENPVDILLINGDLKPSQHFNLENGLKVECLDRIGVILDIFVKRVKDRKATLQVEKARLEYEVPFLREWIHNAKMGEHPGFLGGGEYQVDVYYELTKRRIRKINDDLRSLNETQDLRRTQRRKKGFFLVSIAGYTNAGKSSLLKKLTGEEVAIDSRMFSTLSTITRRMEEMKKSILLTDTIGFLRGLPPFMVESFRATIEDIFMSDLILLVVDAIDPLDKILYKLETSLKIISPPVEKGDIIIVLNKIDSANHLKKTIESIRERMPAIPLIPISVIENMGIEELKDAVLAAFRYPCDVGFNVPNTPEAASFISFLYDRAEVSEINYGDEISISINCRERDYTPILSRIEKLNGRILTAGVR